MKTLIDFFSYEHLPEGPLKETSKLYTDLAQTLNESLPDNPEKTVALRKLLESKDCAVRANL